MSATISGQNTVATAGTAEALASSRIVNCSVMVKALPGNGGTMYVGQVSGDVTSSNGMPLSPGDALIFEFVSDLAEIWIDSTVNGEGVAWLLLSV
jgi:hypothetical protein